MYQSLNVIVKLPHVKKMWGERGGQRQHCEVFEITTNLVVKDGKYNERIRIRMRDGIRMQTNQ